MLLYIWINKHRHIEKTGFNLSSHYKFDFDLKESDTNQIKGELTCEKLAPTEIYNSSFFDIRLIVGENGAGKTTLLHSIIDAIMRRVTAKKRYDGIIIIDKYIFIPDNYELTNILDGFEIIRHWDIVNKYREIYKEGSPPLDENDASAQAGQLATSYLNDYCIIQYSPQPNLDRISNLEGVIAGSSNVYNLSFCHYLDITTENMIAINHKAYAVGYMMFMPHQTQRSELLGYLSEESRRILSFSLSPYMDDMPLVLRIRQVYLEFNSFYKHAIQNKLAFISQDSLLNFILKTDPKPTQVDRTFESMFYESMLYGSILHETDKRYQSSLRNQDNTFNTVLNIVSESYKSINEENRSFREVLRVFLESAEFIKDASNRQKDYSQDLLDKMDEALKFFTCNNDISNKTHRGCIMNISSDTVNKYISLILDGFKVGGSVYYFDIFTLRFDGFSGGEKSLLSFFSRLYWVAGELIDKPETNKFIILLDEFEISLHPAWQIKTINLLHEQLPKFFPNKKIQLMLTSHSPILASDFTNEHILFLKKDKDNGHVIVQDSKMQKGTFGANIYDLYKNSFFIESLPIGEFAKNMIADIIDQIENGEVDEHTLSRIDCIGDVIIRQRIKDLFYNKAGNELKKLYLENELKKLNEQQT